ncbi:thiol:disulfide interchange protein DsbA/DsbL [Shewanella vesiculosa]|uniref:thiol:disulfide interchange protein DsbA/DsbL n=1 Tax=Shewanella vesiculosa TaxID=518738 RepID=UPI000F4E488F|nr:thiol:disulfide interchange protein DsbA/DsbL [Shewanella vesiculosa]RPA55732.1 thiol:disulfide interchange protein DsbA/DsbL [Shewanella vesiculosa]UJL41265.1 thiol:disulfide interchange protein DsbA/DsbL [Shewanella vesiculosa]
MIKYFAITLMLITASFSTLATPFIAGKHYTQISNNMVTSSPKITEFFSFYCHNCFNMETQYLPEIKAGLDKQISFDTKHVDFMNSDLGTEVMRSLAVIHQVGQADKLNHAMFSAIQGDAGANGHDHNAQGHQHQSQINSREDIRKVFSQFGIDAATYDNIADSSNTEKQLALWRQQQTLYKVNSVPTFIVNDKYAINMNEMNSLDQLIELMNFLALSK